MSGISSSRYCVHSLLFCHHEPSRKVCFHSLNIFTSDIDSNQTSFDPLFFRLNKLGLFSLKNKKNLLLVCYVLQFLSYLGNSRLCWTHTTLCQYILLRRTKLDKVRQIKNSDLQITLYTWHYFPNGLFPCKRSWHHCRNSLKRIQKVINFVKINQSQNLYQESIFFETALLITVGKYLEYIYTLNLIYTASSTLLSLLPFQEGLDETLKSMEERSKDYQEYIKVCFSLGNPWHLGLINILFPCCCTNSTCFVYMYIQLIFWVCKFSCSYMGFCFSGSLVWFFL